jgi:hypothetical protein
MLVRDCVVSDGKDNNKRLIDHRGFVLWQITRAYVHRCTLDTALMAPTQYSGAMEAYSQATVFKWPDESAVSFSCQLTLCMLEDDECRALTVRACVRTHT